MAKRKHKTPSLPGVTEPFEWETHVTLRDGTVARTARPRLEVARISDTAGLDDNGDVAETSVRVCRVTRSPIMKTLPEAHRAALLEYAEASEAIHARGGSDLAGGAGGAPSHMRSPSHTALMAAERLRHLQAVLSGVAILRPGKGLRQTGMVAVRHVDLVQWIACEDLAKSAILSRLSLPGRSKAVDQALQDAILEAGRILATRCGFIQSAQR
ncbi:MAG: hypothetical protein AAF376_17785 [Pseudomonadota bacterium]